MRQALIINRCNSLSSVIDIRNISELHNEDFLTSGVVLFFDKDFELILWGSSYDDVLQLAKDMDSDDVYGYHIIYDEEQPYSEKEVDNIYEGLNNDIFSIVICNRNKKLEAHICLN